MDPEPSLFFSTNLDINLIIGFVGIFILLFLSAIVSGAEVALFSLSQKDIDDTLQADLSKGKIISNLLDKPKKLLATLLVANNFFNIGVVILFSFIGQNIFAGVLSPVFKFALEISETFAWIYPKIIEKGFSRIPVYRDNIDQIEGVLFVKDLLPHIDKKEFDWTSLMREPFFVPENKKLDNLLKDFQSLKSHLAIVVDD